MAASIRQAAEKRQRHVVVRPQTFTPADFWAWVGVSSEHSEWTLEHRNFTSANHREFHFRINKGKNIEVACKTTRRYHIINLQNEIEMLKRVDNKHIVRFIGSFEPLQRTDTYSLVMSPVGEGDLEKYLKDFTQDAPNSSQSNVLRGWFLCLASALNYLHANGIRHEDIKPSNIIYLGNTILFTDFGSSTTFNPDNTTSTESQAYGTARYQAPEIRDRTQVHGARSDIFSLGCVFLEMLTVVMGLPLNQLHSFYSVSAGSMNRTPGSFLYCNVIDQLDKWFFGETPGMELAVVWKEIVQPMLHPDRKKRPKALHVVRLLQTGFIPAILPSYCTDCNGVFDFEARCKPGLIEFCGEHLCTYASEIEQMLMYIAALPSVSDDQWPSDAIDDPSTRVKVLTNLYHLLVSQVPSVLWQKSLSTSLSMNMKGFRGHLEACLIEVLQYASSKGNEGLVKALLRYRADINAPGQHWGSALQAARSGGFERIIRILHENGATDDPQGNLGTFLAVISYHGNEMLASMLLKGDYASENAWEELSKALEIASYRGHELVVNALLRAGADPNAGSATYGTALIAASYHGHVNVVRQLLKAGADVNVQAAPHTDALCAASQAGHARIVKILLDRGMKDESRDERCERALQAAAEGDYDSRVQQIHDWLIQLSAEDDITDDDAWEGDLNDSKPTLPPPIIEPDGSAQAEENAENFTSWQILGEESDHGQKWSVDQDHKLSTPLVDSSAGSSTQGDRKVVRKDLNLFMGPTRAKTMNDETEEESEQSEISLLKRFKRVSTFLL